MQLVPGAGSGTQEAVFSPAIKKQIYISTREFQISLRKPALTWSFQAVSVNSRELGF